MATGFSDIDKQKTPRAPVITGSDDNGTSIFLTFDDSSRDEKEAETTDYPQHLQQQDILTPDRRPTLLHPGSASSLRPLTLEHSFSPMAFEDGTANAGVAAPTLKNPFNFQTQVISTSPVKSVRALPLPHRLRACDAFPVLSRVSIPD